MTSQSFCYWLQGHFELAGDANMLNPTQVQTIRNHLNLVFKHELDPAIDGGDTAFVGILQQVHDDGLPSHMQAGKPDSSTLIRC